MYQPKSCESNNKDEDNSPNTLNDKNDQTWSKKFRQIKSTIYFFKYLWWKRI